MFGYRGDKIGDQWAYVTIDLSQEEFRQLEAEVARHKAVPVELKEPATDITHTTAFDPFGIPTPDPELVKMLAEPNLPPAENNLPGPEPIAMLNKPYGRALPLADEGPGYGD